MVRQPIYISGALLLLAVTTGLQLLASYAGAERRPIVAEGPTFVWITAGQDHTCGLAASHQAFCWGSDAKGQLGTGSADGQSHNEPAPVATTLRFQSISAGFQHTCALDPSGLAYCWGSNEYGQLGTRSRTDAATPIAVFGGLTFQSISSGATHTCGLTPSGIAYCWGGNWHGQIGDGTLDGDVDTTCCHKVPVKVKTTKRFSMIRAGGISTCAIAKDQRAYCWGNGNDSRLGVNAGNLQDRSQPEPVASDSKMILIAARGHHACALSTDGHLFCWGQASEGQLATASNGIERVDAPSLAARGLLFNNVDVGMYHTCAIAKDKHLYCWGGNRFREATGDDQPVTSPKLLFPTLTFEMVSAGGNDFSGHTCAISSTKNVVCWGDNRRGQLGPFAR